MTTNLNAATISFMRGFSCLCYHLVRTGNIKISAILNEDNPATGNTLRFPDLGNVTIDQVYKTPLLVFIAGLTSYDIE